MNQAKEVFEDYVRSQVNLLFEIGVMRQSDEHEQCFQKVVAHLKNLYRVAPSVFPIHHVERITRYKQRFETGDGLKRHETADFEKALQFLKSADYTSLDSKCRTLQDVVNLVVRQNHKNRQLQIGGSATLVVRRVTRKHRTPHCWNCKRGLDNYYQLECTSCWWIVCPCGACGCGWEQRGEIPVESERNARTGFSVLEANETELDEMSLERSLLDAELGSERENFQRSSEDGWFYPDEEGK